MQFNKIGLRYFAFKANTLQPKVVEKTVPMRKPEPSDIQNQQKIIRL